jgi:uncharacterized protein YybS (DUF2232 family)
MPCSSRPPWLDHSNFTWRRAQVMKWHYYIYRKMSVKIRITLNWLRMEFSVGFLCTWPLTLKFHNNTKFLDQMNNHDLLIEDSVTWNHLVNMSMYLYWTFDVVLIWQTGRQTDHWLTNKLTNEVTHFNTA